MSAKVSAAFVKAQAEIEKASKDKTNPHFRNKYADLGAVVDAIKPALERHGLAFLQKFHHDDKGITVETIIIHESGETLSNGTLNVPASKMDAQGFGSACTYARRYSLQAAFGVAPEDDDGNAASGGTKSAASRQPATAIAEHEPAEADADAAIVAQLNAAATVPDLVKVMNGLPAEQKRTVTHQFNQRMNELKKAA
jgi:hypothetical protein